MIARREKGSFEEEMSVTDAGSGAFDHDLGIDGFSEDAFDAVLERHLRVGAGAASAAETEEDGFAGDGDDFEIAAVGLEHSPEFFKFFSDCLFHDVLPFLGAVDAAGLKPYSVYGPVR